MKIIILLLCLGLDRFTPIGKWVRNYSWLNTYFAYHQKWLGHTPFGKGVLGLVMALAPAVIVVAIIQWILCYFMFHIAAIIFAGAIFLYALGAMPTIDLFNNGKSATKTTTIEETARHEGATQMTSSGFLWQAQTNMFAVLFWFIVLGPAGAVLYRFSRLLAEQTYVEDSPQIREGAGKWIACLDWLPVRLLGLCFTLAGHFENAFKVWTSQLLSTPKNNEAYLNACCQAALANGDSSDRMQWALYQRAVAILLIVLALVALASWMH